MTDTQFISRKTGIRKNLKQVALAFLTGAGKLNVHERTHRASYFQARLQRLHVGRNPYFFALRQDAHARNLRRVVGNFRPPGWPQRRRVGTVRRAEPGGFGVNPRRRFNWDSGA